MRRGSLYRARGWLLGCPSHYAKRWLLVSLGVRPRMAVEASLWTSCGAVPSGTAHWDRAGAGSPLESGTALGLGLHELVPNLVTPTWNLSSFNHDSSGLCQLFSGLLGRVSIQFGVISSLGLSRGTTETLVA